MPIPYTDCLGNALSKKNIAEKTKHDGLICIGDNISVQIRFLNKALHLKAFLVLKLIENKISLSHKYILWHLL